MPNPKRADSVRRVRQLCRSATHLLFAAAVTLIAFTSVSNGHEGHDHDKPPPLNLPIAPRVIAVTPDYELVGVLSGRERLTIFLHHFETGEPVKDAKLTVSIGDNHAEAQAKEDGVFEVAAQWIAGTQPVDILFSLRFPNDEDVLTGRLESVGMAAPGLPASATQIRWSQTLYIGVAALMSLAVLLLLARGRRSRHARSVAETRDTDAHAAQDGSLKVKRLSRASAIATAVGLAALSALAGRGQAEEAGQLPSVPSTMATDQPQRMADGSIFVPKATQHLLSVRTVLARESKSPRTVQLVGTVIADPNSFGRVQTGHAGRIAAPEGGLAYVGKRVQKDDVLAHLQHHIEAYNKGNLQGEIAELEARIALNEAKLARYLQAPLAIPPIKIDETRGEIRALQDKRRELMPTLVEREEIRAPISGIVSIANAVPGQVVDAREIVFEIVDPSRFWVEAIAHDPSVVAHLNHAYAVTNSGERLPLEFAGAGLSLKQQAAPLTFRVTQASPGLSIGKPVTVILQSTVELDGIVLPASSVVRAASGLSIVWIKSEPERFEPRTIRYQPLDGQRVVVLGGLKPELRVVTEGATLLNQIR